MKINLSDTQNQRSLLQRKIKKRHKKNVFPRKHTVISPTAWHDFSQLAESSVRRKKIRRRGLRTNQKLCHKMRNIRVFSPAAP